MSWMEGFRFVALGYALLVFLIAPAWLSADEESDSAVSVPAVEESAAAVQEAVPDVPELPVDTPPTASEQADEPEPEAARKREAKRKPKAEPAKAGEQNKPPEQEPAAKAAASASVTISDFKFTPDTVTVNEGDTVTWTNDGPTVHTATAEDGSFDTGTLRKGESGSATFTSAGTINYICSPHPYMKGKVIVQAANAGSGPGSGSDGGSDDPASTGADDGSAVAGDEASLDGASGLPNTGFEALSVALLGVATLGLGLLLRRRNEI
jgi:LPXTG-motif cell wall-anchored protein